MKRLLPLIVVLIFASWAFSDSPPAGVQVSGATSKPGTWTPDKIRADLAADIKSVDYTTHGDKHTASAVPLIALLKASGTSVDLKMDSKADPKTKNMPLRMAVVVEGADGYTVTFSMAELLGDIGAKDVWVCLDQDGKPLADKDGPLRLIVPSDAKPGRWVHAVAKITVIDPIAPPTSQPATK